MPEGPMNIEPKPLDLEVETTYNPDEAVDKQKTGLTDVPVDAKAEPVHFPTPTPRLTSGGQKTLNALRGKK